MNSKTAKLISPERVQALLDCYGANPEAWPDDERATALALIENSADLRSRQREAELLDQYLASGNARPAIAEPVDSKLVARIINHLPKQNSSDPVELPTVRKSTSGSWFDFSGWTGGGWIGMAAASVAVVVISVSILNVQPSSNSQPQARLVQTELDEWMWEQVTGETSGDDEEPVTFLTLL